MSHSWWGVVTVAALPSVAKPLATWQCTQEGECRAELRSVEEVGSYCEAAEDLYSPLLLYVGADRKCKSKNYERACVSQHLRL